MKTHHRIGEILTRKIEIKEKVAFKRQPMKRPHQKRPWHKKRKTEAKKNLKM